MPGHPDRFRGWENEEVVSPEEAAELLFGMFGDEILGGERLPDKTRALFETGVLYASGKGEPVYIAMQRYRGVTWVENIPRVFSRMASTRVSTPDSPLITPENIEGAESIVTATWVQHWLGFGPDRDIVIADGERAYRYKKGKRRKPQRGAFDELNSLRQANRLLTEQPERHQSGVLLERWVLDKEEDSYLLFAGFGVRRLSLKELINELAN